MPKYKPIKIKLNEQEDAEVYYQKVCGKNETVRRHARILYYAGQGTASLLLERYEKTESQQCISVDVGKSHAGWMNMKKKSKKNWTDILQNQFRKSL